MRFFLDFSIVGADHMPLGDLAVMKKKRVMKQLKNFIKHLSGSKR